MYCMKAQDRASWLRDYCNKLCTDVVVIVNNSMSTFNPITLPGDMLQVEKNDICHLCDTDAGSTVMHIDNQSQSFGMKGTNVGRSPIPIASYLNLGHSSNSIMYATCKNDYDSKPTSIVYSSVPMHSLLNTDVYDTHTNEIDNGEKKIFRARCIGERAESNRARMSRPVKRKQALIEDRTVKLTTYGVDKRNDAINTLHKYSREMSKLEKDVELVDEMKRKKEDLMSDRDPLLCFSMAEVSTLRPTGSIGGGKKWKWDIPTKPRVTIKFGKVYTNREIVETCKYLVGAYTRCWQLYERRPNQDAIEAEDYRGSFDTNSKEETTLYIGRTDRSFVQYTCNLPEEGDDEQETTNGGDKTPPLSNEEIKNKQWTGDIRTTTNDTSAPGAYIKSKNRACTESLVACTSVNNANQKDTSVINTALGPCQIELVAELRNKEYTKPIVEIGAPKTTTKEDTPAVNTAPESPLSQAKSEIRQSTRKRGVPDKFGECYVHDPTLKMILPMRKNKKNAFEPHQYPATGTNTPTEKAESIAAVVPPNKSTNKLETMKCSMKLCPGFSPNDGITYCCKCHRTVHKKDKCSILCSHGENDEEVKEERTCIDCYSCPLLRKS